MCLSLCNSFVHILAFMFKVIGDPRKFKGGIGHGGHLAVTYGGQFIVPSDFSGLSLQSNFV